MFSIHGKKIYTQLHIPSLSEISTGLGNNEMQTHKHTDEMTLSL